ncbi:major facilitator superfamily domain-containing protein [Xylariales sp. PMI_506]|nr:major facilitator superfamily domain-containing protein [Xylariales sp. PMI_506]
MATQPSTSEPIEPSQQGTLPTEAKTGKAEWTPTKDFLLVMLALCTLMLAIAIDSTSLSVALPTVSENLNGTALQAFWSGTSFLLASSVLQPTVASLSDILGRKYMIYVSIVFFAAGSLVAALAHDFTILLLGRTIQGVGGGSLIALTEIVITDLVPLAHRGTWFSLISALWSLGTVTGPLIGAGFAQNVTWRWIFYINLPIIGLGAGFVAVFLRQARIPGSTARKLAGFDWLGSVLFTIGSTAFLFGITVGGTMYAWGAWQTIVSIIMGLVVIGVFGVWELHFAATPIINRKLFSNWSLINTYAQILFQSIILWSLLYFLVLYYQGVKLYSPVTSAVAVLPETLTVAPSAVVVGIIAGKTLRYRWALWGGWALTVLGAGLLYLLDVGTTVPQWIFLNLPIGLGEGMLFPAMSLSIQAASEPALNGQAAAFGSFMRTFGQSIGVAVSGVIFQNALRTRLAALPDFTAAAAEALSRDATALVNRIDVMAPGLERSELMQAFADGLKVLWLSLIGFAAVGMVLSATIRAYSLEQEHVTEQRLLTSGEAKSPPVSDEESGSTMEK